MKYPCVYILTNRRFGTLYTGVTSNLPKRIVNHKNYRIKGFTEKYKVDKLIWYEFHPTMESAISREKNIKSWKRNWKIKLIETANKEWKDLFSDLLEVPMGKLYF